MFVLILRNKLQNGSNLPYLAPTLSSLSLMQTYELTAENIASFEMIESKGRIPTNMHAIYFLTPVSFYNFHTLSQMILK